MCNHPIRQNTKRNMHSDTEIGKHSLSAETEKRAAFVLLLGSGLAPNKHKSEI